MSEQVRSATRELRWEQIQAAITDLLAEGTTPISMMEIARRCDIPRSTLSKESDWKAAISAAEAERVRRRTEQLQQLRVGFLTPVAGSETEGEITERRVTLEGIVHDLRALLSQAGQDSQTAYDRGREEALAEIRQLPPAEDAEERIARAFAEGREAGRNEFSEDLNQAYERGVKDGRDVATEITALQEAYERGLQEGRAQSGNLNEAYERGRQEGFAAGSAEAKTAYDRGRQMGRAELQVELKQAFEQGYKEGKSEAASDVMNAYDRGRRDGWEEGRRDAASGRSMFGFTVKGQGPNPDKEWALALMHATPNATPDQLRTTYRMLTKAYHPDRNPDIPPEFIRNLNRAKEILGF